MHALTSRLWLCNRGVSVSELCGRGLGGGSGTGTGVGVALKTGQAGRASVKLAGQQG